MRAGWPLVDTQRRLKLARGVTAMPCPYKVDGLAHLAEVASEIKTACGLIVPRDIAMRDGPFLNLCRFGHRFAEGGAREAARSFVSADPDQVPVKLHEHVLSRAAPPRFVFVDITVARRNEPGDLLRGGGVREAENS